MKLDTEEALLVKLVLRHMCYIHKYGECEPEHKESTEDIVDNIREILEKENYSFEDLAEINIQFTCFSEYFRDLKNKFEDLFLDLFEKEIRGEL